MNHCADGVSAADIVCPQDSGSGPGPRRQTGIETIGALPWGTHFCQFYATPQDLLETLVPYFREGLAANEFCMWVTSAPLKTEEAKAALRAAVPDLDERLARGQIEILDHDQWYTRSGSFDAEWVIQNWTEKLQKALLRGFSGLRLTGNTFWLEDAEWEDFKQYENAVHRIIGGLPVLALCSYSLDRCGPREILDVVANHEFALIRRGGEWETLRGVEHQAEQALRESRERLAHFAAIVFEGVLISENGRVVDCNEQYAQMLGYSIQELKGMPIENLVAPEDRERVIGNIRLGRESHVEHAAIRKDGSRILVETRGRNSPLNPVQRYTVLRDITVRKQAELELRESEERFRAMVQAVPSLTFEGDAEGLSTFVSESWCAYTGMSEEETRGWGWAKALHPEDSEAAAARWAAAARTGSPFESTHRLRAADGSYRWFIGRALPTRGADGEIVRWSGSLTDIDDLVRAEQSLLEASRRKDEFLAMLAHELRNPLAPIRNAAHVLGRLGLEEPRVKWAREVIEGQVAHLARLVDDLLDVSRIVRGKITLKKEEIDFATLAERALEAVQPLIESKRHRLVVRLPKEPVRLEADPVRLSQVLLNLLDNAAKYNPDGGRIEFEARVEGREIEVQVKDDGIGVSAELLPHIFELFQQGERTLDRAQGGLGIGLTLVQRLVEMHGGRVEARSEGPGQGAVFILRLPIKLAPSASPMHGQEEKKSCASGMRVLVVDDDLAVADSTAVLLELDGHEVRLAHSGHAALELVPLFRPQVVLLDIGLEGMDGFETAKRLRQLPEGRSLCLMAVTGYGDEETKTAALAAGCDCHLVKPVRIDLLTGLLAEVSQSPQP